VVGVGVVRGRNSIQKRIKRRQQNVVDEKMLLLKQKLEQEREVSMDPIQHNFSHRPVTAIGPWSGSAIVIMGERNGSLLFTQMRVEAVDMVSVWFAPFVASRRVGDR
jgi:hypothetical protein